MAQMVIMVTDSANQTRFILLMLGNALRLGQLAKLLNIIILWLFYVRHLSILLLLVLLTYYCRQHLTQLIKINIILLCQIVEELKVALEIAHSIIHTMILLLKVVFLVLVQTYYGIYKHLSVQDVAMTIDMIVTKENVWI